MTKSEREAVKLEARREFAAELLSRGLPTWVQNVVETLRDEYPSWLRKPKGQ